MTNTATLTATLTEEGPAGVTGGLSGKQPSELGWEAVLCVCVLPGSALGQAPCVLLPRWGWRSLWAAALKACGQGPALGACSSRLVAQLAACLQAGS